MLAFRTTPSNTKAYVLLGGAYRMKTYLSLKLRQSLCLRTIESKRILLHSNCVSDRYHARCVSEGLQKELRTSGAILYHALSGALYERRHKRGMRGPWMKQSRGSSLGSICLARQFIPVQVSG